MTNSYRAMCAELVDGLHKHTSMWEGHEIDLVARARALLAQPVAEGPKPMVDYSRVPEIATEAQIRSAAQYLVKKRNCDGDLIPAIEYAIARWGCPTPPPVPEPQPPTDEEIMELMPQQMRDDLAAAARALAGFTGSKASTACRIILNRHAVDHARAALAKYGSTTPQLVAEGPTDDELMDIARATDLVYYMGKDCGFASPYMEGTDITAEVLAYARAAFAKWGHQ